MRKNRGITLIALIITIIVLLILAGVALRTLTGYDNIPDQASKVVEKYQNGEEVGKEQVIVEKTDEILSEYMGYFVEKSTIIELSSKEKTRKVPIPEGYQVSEISGENTIKDGLVVYQIPNGAKVDWENNLITYAGADGAVNLQENANQFVWIPVDDINDMIMCKKNGDEAGICNLIYDSNTEHIICETHNYTTSTNIENLDLNTEGLAGRIYSTGSEPKGGNFTTFNGVQYQLYKMTIDYADDIKSSQKFIYNSGKREPSAIKNDESNGLTNLELNQNFIAMAKSVAKYKGFFVARYETSTKIESKKNKSVLNNINWYGFYNKLKNDSSSITENVKGNTHMIWRMPV